MGDKKEQDSARKEDIKQSDETQAETKPEETQPKDGKTEVTVKVVSGRRKQPTVRIFDREDFIDDVLAAVTEEHGYGSSEDRDLVISHKGKDLELDATLQECGVRAGDTLFIAAR